MFPTAPGAVFSRWATIATPLSGAFSGLSRVARNPLGFRLCAGGCLAFGPTRKEEAVSAGERMRFGPHDVFRSHFAVIPKTISEVRHWRSSRLWRAWNQIPCASASYGRGS